ncbi:hypothetical protein FRB99_005727 [Tulasnella sp. 403]|nr:hypothetical protein FRB99_005727 [Tulasnella sp. 403]
MPGSDKQRITPSSDSQANVVDHFAPNVTEESNRPIRMRPNVDKAVIKVQPLQKSEMQQSYAQNLGLGDVEHGAYGTLINALGSCIGFCGAFPCMPCPNPYRSKSCTGSVGLVSRFGQFYRAVDPGLVNVNVCSESLRIVDVKIQIATIGRQTVITRDNVNVEIDSVIYFQITNPYRAAFGISDLRQALIERAQTTLRHVVGARAVQSVVTERDAIALEIEEIVGDVADKWGVAIEGILIKDITFSADVAASLSSAAQQKRLGESKVIAARAEVDAARLMRTAADILSSPAAMQIRQLEALQTMAKSAQSKVVFVPMQLQNDIIGAMSRTEGQAELSTPGAGSSGQNAIAGSSSAGATIMPMGGTANAGLLESVANID